MPAARPVPLRFSTSECAPAFCRGSNWPGADLAPPTCPRLKALRAELVRCGADAFIVLNADERTSEFAEAAFTRRVVISSFTDSAGTAVATPFRALLLTGDRYFLLVEADLGPTWSSCAPARRY